ncbi:HAD-IB family hydrolase [Streptomyces sp. NPDC051320]|uniref:HAD family hydrolase n=1 Tax=Streptomyces sp. NPDC051320 TaxID=3154644 RepID=UPI0034437656
MRHRDGPSGESDESQQELIGHGGGVAGRDGQGPRGAGVPLGAPCAPIDGTLTAETTLFRFLRYYLAAQGHGAHEYDHRRRRLAAMTAIGIPRERTNLAYFENFRNAEATTVSRIAQEWFEAELRRGGFFNGHVLAALHRHQENGNRTVLVSGSFPACLGPLAEHTGVDDIWCTPPEIVNGRYTGGLVGPPMIGHAKADAVRLSAAGYGASLDDCVAYGDHISDLPMLRATGSAVVVGEDKELLAQGGSRPWGLLPGALPPPPLPLPPPMVRPIGGGGSVAGGSGPQYVEE